MSCRPRAAAWALLLLGAACPPPLSLECASCADDLECAPQGLLCRAGRCAAPGALRCPDGADGGAGLPPLGSVPESTTLFEDDFESGALVGGSGKWDSIQNPSSPNQSIGVAADGGRAGAGFVLRDTSPANGQGGRFAARALLSRSSTYARVSVRLTSSGSTGPHALAFYSEQDGAGGFQVPGATLGEALLRDGVAKLKCGDRSTMAEECPASAAFTEGAWHQVELLLENLGTAQGVCALRLDGREVCRLARDWQGVGSGAVALGASAMNPAWVGELLADNLAVTQGGPAPAQLTWVAPARPSSARCVPLRLELRDGLDGGLARAVRPLRFALQSGAAQVYAADCQGPALRTLEVGAGQAAATLGLRAPTGQVTLGARDLGEDLSAGSITLTLGD